MKAMLRSSKKLVTATQINLGVDEQAAAL